MLTSSDVFVSSDGEPWVSVPSDLRSCAVRFSEPRLLTSNATWHDVMSPSPVLRCHAAGASAPADGNVCANTCLLTVATTDQPHPSPLPAPHVLSSAFDDGTPPQSPVAFFAPLPLHRDKTRAAASKRRRASTRPSTPRRTPFTGGPASPRTRVLFCPPWRPSP